jgi:hypothetical protein
MRWMKGDRCREAKVTKGKRKRHLGELGDRCAGAKGMRGAGEVTGRGERRSGGQMEEGGESGNGGSK